MIITLKQWSEQVAKLWDEALRDVDHAEALQDNELWDEVSNPPTATTRPVQSNSGGLTVCEQAQHATTQQPQGIGRVHTTHGGGKQPITQPGQYLTYAVPVPSPAHGGGQ